MHNCDWRGVDLVQGSESGEGDAVVASEGEDFGDMRRWGGRIVGEGGGARAELEKGGCHLFQREGVVEGRHGYVAAVEDRVGTRVRVQSAARVKAPEGALAGGGRADGAGAEAGSWAVGHRCVKGSADDGDVVGSSGAGGEAFVVWEVGESGDAAEGPLVVEKGKYRR